MRDVHVVVPEGIDDPARPSGGNVYDRRLCGELAARGWAVHEHAAPGDWPQPDAGARTGLAQAVERLPDGAVTLLDGLVACAAPEALVPHARRLREVVLVHMPLGDRPLEATTRAREGEVLSAATAVVTTSAWSRRRLLELYALAPERVHVAEPGVDAAAPTAPAAGSTSGGALLCVAAVTPDKGHDVLLDALAKTTDLPWRCTCVGSLGRDRSFADGVRRRAHADGLRGRVRFTGPRTGPELDRAYAEAGLLVLGSRAETYGMVVTESLARGLPVLATDVGGVPEALGRAADGTRPGLLVAPGDAAALGGALRSWLTDRALRQCLRRAAVQRRTMLPRWSDTASVVDQVLAGGTP